MPGLQCTAVGIGNSVARLQIRKLKLLGSSDSPLCLRVPLYLIWQPAAFSDPASCAVSTGVQSNVSVFPLTISRQQHTSAAGAWFLFLFITLFSFPLKH